MRYKEWDLCTCIRCHYIIVTLVWWYHGTCVIISITIDAYSIQHPYSNGDQLQLQPATFYQSIIFSCKKKLHDLLGWGPVLEYPTNSLGVRNDSPDPYLPAALAWLIVEDDRSWCSESGRPSREIDLMELLWHIAVDFSLSQLAVFLSKWPASLALSPPIPSNLSSYQCHSSGTLSAAVLWVPAAPSLVN